MKNVLIGLLGSYEPLLNVDGTIVNGIAGIDFVWLIGAFGFFFLVGCFFKILAVVIKAVQ